MRYQAALRPVECSLVASPPRRGQYRDKSPTWQRGIRCDLVLKRGEKITRLAPGYCTTPVTALTRSLGEVGTAGATGWSKADRSCPGGRRPRCRNYRHSPPFPQVFLDIAGHLDQFTGNRVLGKVRISRVAVHVELGYARAGLGDRHEVGHPVRRGGACPVGGEVDFYVLGSYQRFGERDGRCSAARLSASNGRTQKSYRSCPRRDLSRPAGHLCRPRRGRCRPAGLHPAMGLLGLSRRCLPRRRCRLRCRRSPG